jgi:hypothetical protein
MDLEYFIFSTMKYFKVFIMVEVIRNKKYIRNYTLDMLWVSCKLLIIINIAILPFMIYFLLVGIFSDKEAFKDFVRLIECFILLLVINIRMFFHYKKINLMFFSTCDEDGNVKELITLENDEYVVNNITHQTINRIKKNEIKSISQTKRAIIIKTIYNQKLIFLKMMNY